MIVSDLYPVNCQVLPKLYAYHVDTSDNKSSIAGKLAYRFKKRYPAHWASYFGTLISDRYLEVGDLDDFVHNLWELDDSPFRNLYAVRNRSDWSPTPIEVSEFVARGFLSDFDQSIVSRMKSESVTNIRGVKIERQHEFRGWTVQNIPSVSISVSSKIFLEENLSHYIGIGVDPVGQYVSVAHQTTKGEVTGVLGPLRNHRDRLMKIAQDEHTIKTIEEAADNVEVVTVRSGQSNYSYIASSLNIVLTLQNASTFGVSARQISRHLKIPPDYRKKLVNKILNAMTTKVDSGKVILGSNFESATSPNLFPRIFTTPYNEPVIVGNNKECDFNPRSIMFNLEKYGLYKYSDKLVNNNIKMGVLRDSTYQDKTKIKKVVDNIKNELRNLNFTLEITDFAEFSHSDVAELQRSVYSLIDLKSDIILALIPESTDEEGDVEEVDLYHAFKEVTIRKEIGSQVVNFDTIQNEYAIPNIVLGILGKTGNIPYVLSNPLDFCDIVVGLDIAREKKQNLPGTKNAAAIARVYFNNGNFMRYTIHDAPIEGETVPPEVLKSLFPLDEFEYKRVVIHRDGYFRGDEVKTLYNWAKSINAQFSLVEVIKREAPRLYDESDGVIGNPKKGSLFRVDDSNVFLISSPPPFKDCTPRPVRIRNHGPISLENAVKSVLALTQLHYGSLNPPRMPVTIHYSDKIAYLALRGIKPPHLSGNVPFWL